MNRKRGKEKELREDIHPRTIIIEIGAWAPKNWRKTVYKKAKTLFKKVKKRGNRYVLEFSQPCSIGGLTVTFTHIKEVQTDYIGFLGIETLKECKETYEKLFGKI